METTGLNVSAESLVCGRVRQGPEDGRWLQLQYRVVLPDFPEGRGTVWATRPASVGPGLRCRWADEADLPEERQRALENELQVHRSFFLMMLKC